MLHYHLFGLSKLLPVVVDSRRLHHKSVNLSSDLLNAALELSVNLIGSYALFAKVVDLPLETSVAIDNFTVPNEKLASFKLSTPLHSRRRE